MMWKSNFQITGNFLQNKEAVLNMSLSTYTLLLATVHILYLKGFNMSYYTHNKNLEFWKKNIVI